ncbi:hypothetical protein [Ectothiorhodospira mobilis]|uniref:HNH endonuclease n=1 Tax=Ectothiorhodospira mobilis TaxID=195064 RepID=A0A1I4SWI8_ECTMO|nr:hypothetical protein [Ectothiorhodospira mobilis]MCG5535008.1 hypothetical protein [Ectothiorhodospira mobilis]SFM68765.1 hypothetical protein SAMN05421721_12326 [Ectothiorhodospira mobilis]
MTEASRPERCALCGRVLEELTRHHLIPRARHHNRRNKRRFGRTEVRERVIWVCRPCHSQVHRVLDEKTLERSYNTLEALQGHPEIRRFTRWIADKPAGFRPKGGRRRRR